MPDQTGFERADATEKKYAAQYESDREAIASFLHRNFEDHELLRRFWWYRGEEKEVGMLPPRGWARTNG